MSVSTKLALRKQLQARRDRIPAATRNTFSKSIVEQLIQMIDWAQIDRIHCYIPIAIRSEVDTWPLLQFIWQQWPGIEVVVPGPLVSDRPIAYHIDAQTRWRKMGMTPYPLDRDVDLNGTYDLIVVPCLGFDSSHYRLGYGGGYYDRLLTTQPEASTIGVAFWAGFVAGGLPHEGHDVPLQRIVTEKVVL